MNIEILTVAHCPSAQAAQEEVAAALAEEGLHARVSIVTIDDQATAEARFFLGSPTVRVDGMDCEPARRADTAYGMTCRVYRRATGIAGTPGKELLRAAFHEAHCRETPRFAHILFVCVHNAGRSQIAEAFVNTLAAARGLRVRAESAGTVVGAEINPVVRQVMTEVNVPMEGQTPKQLTQAMADAADRIITMGCGVDAEACPARIHLSEDWGLDDPHGQPVERVRAIRDQIQAKVEEMLSAMGAGA